MCATAYAYLRRGQESLRILTNPTLWPVNSVDCISLSVNMYPHCAELPLCNQAFAVGCDAWWMSSSALYFSISSSLALCPRIPSLHLVVRWKIGETLFSLFPLTQNRPGLLKWPLLHLPIGTEPRISPWKKNPNFSQVFLPIIIIKWLVPGGKCFTLCAYLVLYRFKTNIYIIKKWLSNINQVK